MRRRQLLSQLNPRNNRAPVPSGAGMGAAAVTPPPSPVSREEEARKAVIWSAPAIEEEEIARRVEAWPMLTPSTDPTAAPLVKRRGRPNGSKNKVRS